jgi:predicted ABC-type ATPase
VPHVVILAGPNGAGKTTAAPALLRDTLAVEELVNADAIAAGLSAFRPESASFAAGRIMLARLRELAASGTDDVVADPAVWKEMQDAASKSG